LAVDEFSCRVEGAGVAGGLRDGVQQDVAKVVQVRFAEEVVGPPGQGGVRSCCGDDRVCEVRLPFPGR
jgi:hypothetical protein